MINNILITGCSEGLGRALALEFASKGCKVYAVARSSGKLQELAKNTSYIVPIAADISEAAGRIKINEAICKEKDISIIHNAGIAIPATFEQLSENSLREHIETNLIAPLLITQSCIPLLQESQRVLHITSGTATMAFPGLLPYCITKAAMHHAMACLAKELAAKKVGCANLRPGAVDTSLQERFRTADINALPSKDFYVRFKNENKLIEPVVAAQFASWVMLNTDLEEFSETQWNIYDEKYHGEWLGQRSLY